MKVPTRPSRLLNLQKSPAVQKAIAATNATKSHFLRLPAEIRERIYIYVFGGRVLHVGSGPLHKPNSVVICSHSEDYDEGPEGQIVRFETQPIHFYRGSGEVFEVQAHLESHLRCYRRPHAQKHLFLHLLAVCRQIYHEAVLIPFRENVFAVAVATTDIGPFLARFLNHLVPAQLKAIRRLILQYTRVTTSFRVPLMRLKGLETLQYVLVGVNDDLNHHLEQLAFEKFLGGERKRVDFGLPPSCDVRITIRRLLRDHETAPEGGSERIPDGLMESMERARKQMLGGSRPPRN